MRNTVLALVLAGGLFVPAIAQDRGDEDRVRALIEACGDPDPARRDEATSELRALGRKAWSVLERSQTHPDPEIRSRVQHLLREQRLRRQIPYSIMERHPAATDTLGGGASSEKLRLLRVLGGYYGDFQDVLRGFLSDSDPEVVLCAAEVLYENHDRSWVPVILGLYPTPDCPRPGRAAELLASVSSSLPSDRIQTLFDASDERGRVRLLELANESGLLVRVSAEELGRMLENGEERTIRAVLARLRSKSEPTLQPKVEALLDDSREFVVVSALYTLRRSRVRLEPSRVLSLMTHRDLSVREEAAQVAYESADRALIPGFQSLLGDSSLSLRRLALHALWNLQGDDVLPQVFKIYVEEPGEIHEVALELLLRRRSWVAEQVSTLVNSEDALQRVRGAELAFRLEGPKVLTEWVKDSEPAVRRWALERALASEGDLCIQILEQLRQDPVEVLRLDALRGLARRGDRNALEGLSGILMLEESPWRAEAAEVLLARPAPESVPLARTLLDSTDPVVRRMAVRCLDEHGTYEEAARTVALLRLSDARLNKSVLPFLNHAADRGHGVALAALLASESRTYSDAVFESVLPLILAHGDTSVADALHSAIDAGRPGGERLIRGWVLRHSDPVGSFLSLDSPEDPDRVGDLVQVLVSVTADGDGSFENSPRGEILRELKSGRLLEWMLRLLEHDSRRIRRLAADGLVEFQLPKALPVLQQHLADQDPGVRHAAVRTIHRSGSSRHAQALLPLLDDVDPEVRIAALVALARLLPEHRNRIERSVEQEECTWVRRRMEGVLAAWPEGK